MNDEILRRELRRIAIESQHRCFGCGYEHRCGIHGYQVRIAKNKIAASGAEAEELSLKKLRAEVALKESQGQLHKLKTAIAEGKYVDTENAGRDLAEFLRSFRQFALNMPARAVRSMPGQVDAVTAKAMEKAMREELEAMLNAFTDAVTELGSGVKAG